jgi:hypothetical protein
MDMEGHPESGNRGGKRWSVQSVGTRGATTLVGGSDSEHVADGAVATEEFDAVVFAVHNPAFPASTIYEVRAAVLLSLNSIFMIEPASFPLQFWPVQIRRSNMAPSHDGWPYI